MKPSHRLIAAIVSLSLPAAVFGQSTWNGATDGNWNTLSNWTPGALPTNSNGTFNNNVNTTINLANAVPIFQLRFDTSSTGNFTFGGSGFRSSGSGANIRIEANVTNAPTLTWNNNWQTTPNDRVSPAGWSVNTISGSNANLIFNGNMTTSSAVAAPGLIQAIDFKLSNAAAAGGTTVNGIISNSATGTGLTTVTKSGGGQGILTLNGANTYSGSTAWNTDSGSIVLGNKAALGTGIVRIAGTVSTGTISANTPLVGANAVANTLIFNSSSTTNNAVNAIFTTTAGSNVITLGATGTTPAVGDLIYGGTGAVGGNGFIPYYTRVTAVSGSGAGALVTLDQNAIASGTTAAIAVAKYTASSTGTLTITGANAIEFSGTQNLSTVYSNGGAATRTYNVTNTADTTFSGVLQQQNGVASIVKTGTGKLILSGNNTYTGTTTVNANSGTLLINGDQSAAVGAVTIGTGSTLGGTGTVGGATTVNGNLSPGASPGLFTFNSSLTMGVASVTTFEIGSGVRGTDFDGINVVGSFTQAGNLTFNIAAPLANATYNLFDSGSVAGSFASIGLTGAGYGTQSLVNGGGNTWSALIGGQNIVYDAFTGDLDVSAIPEPSTVSILAGLTVLGATALRRRRSVAA